MCLYVFNKPWIDVCTSLLGCGDDETAVDACVGDSMNE